MKKENMTNAERYFKKPCILLDLLNQHKELTLNEISEKMKVSKTIIRDLIKEFNREEEAIEYKNGKYFTVKKKLYECKSYCTVLMVTEKALNNPNNFFSKNEKDLEKELNVKRNIIQKVKALIIEEMKESK